MKTMLILTSLFYMSAVNASTDTLEKMPHDLEVRFALSALPKALREKASVYVLDPATGYVLDRQGTNAQTCLVERTDWQREDYADDVYTAICYDPAGMKSQGQVWLDVAELRAKGTPPAEAKKIIERRFLDGTYKAPERAGVSYMAAPLMRGYASFDLGKKEKRTIVMPHVMYYAPNLTDADFGGIRPPSPFPFILEQGPHGYFIQQLGEKEAREIVNAESSLVRDLCAYRSFLCIKNLDYKHTHASQ
ncbi:MAG: hypothetical protein KGM95_03415 [Betaproteobacteria bacterium]|nr:hypothetical protein [Betaproteobacteria bacterium]